MEVNPVHFQDEISIVRFGGGASDNHSSDQLTAFGEFQDVYEARRGGFEVVQFFDPSDRDPGFGRLAAAQLHFGYSAGSAVAASVANNPACASADLSAYSRFRAACR